MKTPCSMAKVQLPLVQPARPELLDPLHRRCHPFSRSPARDVLRHLPEEISAAAMLLLDCEDPSCLLTTLAAAHPGLQRLTAILNEPNPLQLARIALLLLMVAELDSDSQDDMQVLWEVWYCAAWGPTTLPRVRPFIERLHNSSVPWIAVVRPEDKDTLHRVWSSWLAKDKPSVPRTMMSGQQVKEGIDSLGSCILYDYDLLVQGIVQQFVKLDSVSQFGSALRGSCNRPQADVCATSLVQEVLQRDMKTFHETGCLAPNYHGQEAIRVRSVNVTLLCLRDGKWCANLYSSPALCWGPFGADELVSAVKTGGQSGVMARVCIAHITQLVRNFQANTQLGGHSAAAVQVQGSNNHTQLQVQLVRMGALQLCLGMPLSDDGPAVQPKVPSAQQQKSAARPAPATTNVGRVPPPLLFDAIDSGCLADEFGLLPLLVAAAARLKPAWHARLYHGLTEWQNQQCTLDHYIFKKALCMPASLTPTLLGLRLLTDVEADRPETAEEQEYTYRMDAYRELVWAPIPEELRTSPRPKLSAQLLGGPAGSIEAYLLAVVTQLCCVVREPSKPFQLEHTESTPHLLAWLLASLTERADMSALLEGSSSGSGGQGSNRLAAKDDQDHQGASAAAHHKYVHVQRVLWALRTNTSQLLPSRFQLNFITGIDILRSSLQQQAPQSWQPADVPPCRGVKQLVVPFQGINFRSMLNMFPVLWENKALQVCKQRLSVAGKLEGPFPVGMHIVEMWASDTWGQQHCPAPQRAMITIYLPSDFTLPPGLSMITFMRSRSRVEVTRKSTPLSTVQAPGILAQLLLPSACPSAVLPVTSSPAHQACNAASSQEDAVALKLQIASLQETEDSYVATLELVDGQGKGVTTGDPASRQLLQPNKLRLSHEFCTTGHSAHADSTCSCKLQWQVSTAHRVIVGMDDPAGQMQPAELQLCWPVAKGWTQPYHIPSGSYSTDHAFIIKNAGSSNGQLVLEISKAAAWEIWPSDSAWGVLPAPLDLSSLEPDTQENDLAFLCSDAAQTPPDMHTNDRLRPFIHDIMVMKSLNSPVAGLNTARFTASGTTKTSDGSESMTTLHLLLHHPVLITKACRPVLPVTVLDVSAKDGGLQTYEPVRHVADACSMCEGACARGDMDQDCYHSLLDKLGFEPGRPSAWGLRFSDGCVGLRRLLLRHALASQPTAAQQASLPNGQRIPYYYNSYLSFLQCYHPMNRAQIMPADRKPLPSVASIYMKYRFMEVLAEIDRCDCQHRKLHLCGELIQLLRQEGAKPMPEEIKPAVSMHLFWAATQAATQEGWREWASRMGIINPEQRSDSGEVQEQLEGMPSAATSATAAAEDAAACMQCGKQDCKLLKCGKCGAVQYCSRDCQVAHWKQHRAVCRQVETP